MNLAELEQLISSSEWFSRLGEPIVDVNVLTLPNLAAWAGDTPTDPAIAKVADDMEWLPSSPEMADPIHGDQNEKRAALLGRTAEASARSRDFYQQTLVSLRRFKGHPLLHAGPHDFTEVAKNSLLYAIRRATTEAIVDAPNFWMRVVKFYGQGRWPCGYLPSNQLVLL